MSTRAHHTFQNRFLAQVAGALLTVLGCPGCFMSIGRVAGSRRDVAEARHITPTELARQPLGAQVIITDPEGTPTEGRFRGLAWDVDRYGNADQAGVVRLPPIGASVEVLSRVHTVRGEYLFCGLRVAAEALYVCLQRRGQSEQVMPLHDLPDIRFERYPHVSRHSLLEALYTNELGEASCVLLASGRQIESRALRDILSVQLRGSVHRRRGMAGGLTADVTIAAAVAVGVMTAVASSFRGSYFGETEW